MWKMTVDWNKPIEDIYGYPARVISDDYRMWNRKVRVVQIEKGDRSEITTVYETGCDTVFGSKTIRNRKVEHEAWVNLYRSPEGDIQSGMRTWTSEGAAKEAAAHRKDHIATIKIQWEE
jgi:hypothetical protein